jgi:photosystem II stability/assembly factor-like uncharacterized protein
MTSLGIRLLLVFLATYAANAQSAWWEIVDSTVSTIPTIGYRAIACADDDHCVVVGKEFPSSHDLVKRTTDGGRSWSYVYDEFVDWTGWLRDVAHPTPNLIIAVGDSGIIRSSNAGSTWQKIEIGTRLRLMKIDMLDEREGTVVGEYLYRALRTTDGGASWSLLPTPDSLMTFIDVASPTPGIVFALLQQRLDTPARPTRVFRSTDGGQTYTPLGTLASAGDVKRGFRDADFVDDAVGYAFGYRKFGELIEESTNLVMRTTDGGVSWQTVLDSLVGEVAGGLVAGAFADRNNGIAVGIYATLLRTTDGGDSWVRDRVTIKQSEVPNLWGVAYPTPRRAFAACVVRAQILRLVRENSQVDPPDGPLSDLSLSVAEGWLVGTMANSVILSASVLDVRGATVMDAAHSIVSEPNAFRIPLSGLDRGFYFVRVVSTNGITVRVVAVC